jgi:hypothetical protein
MRLLQKIEKEAGRLQRKMDLLLEVNLAGEQTKYGFAENQVAGALQTAGEFQWSRICGLMIIPPYFDDPEKVRPFFRRLRELQQRLLREFPEFTELSMGMSHDYAVAVEEGATIVRIGTAIFGERPGTFGL